MRRFPKLMIGGVLLIGGGYLLTRKRGWSSLDGVNIPWGLSTKLNNLAAALGQGFVVTSGYRSASQQAAAVASLFDKYGYSWSDVYDLYARDDLIDELYDADREDWASVIAAQVARGDLLSAHQTGNAADISNWRTHEEDAAPTLAQLQAACAEVGADAPIDEGHVYHVEWT